jgi:hypothetical protein
MLHVRALKVYVMFRGEQSTFTLSLKTHVEVQLGCDIVTIVIKVYRNCVFWPRIYMEGCVFGDTSLSGGWLYLDLADSNTKMS